jgi:hypothetical protein
MTWTVDVHFLFQDAPKFTRVHKWGFGYESVPSGVHVMIKPRPIYKYIQYDAVYFDNFMTLYEYDVIFLVMSKIRK